jgi:hypothetical protein
VLNPGKHMHDVLPSFGNEFGGQVMQVKVLNAKI